MPSILRLSSQEGKEGQDGYINIVLAPAPDIDACPASAPPPYPLYQDTCTTHRSSLLPVSSTSRHYKEAAAALALHPPLPVLPRLHNSHIPPFSSGDHLPGWGVADIHIRPGPLHHLLRPSTASQTYHSSSDLLTVRDTIIDRHSTDDLESPEAQPFTTHLTAMASAAHSRPTSAPSSALDTPSSSSLNMTRSSSSDQARLNKRKGTSSADCLSLIVIEWQSTG